MKYFLKKGLVIPNKIRYNVLRPAVGDPSAREKAKEIRYETFVESVGFFR